MFLQSLLRFGLQHWRSVSAFLIAGSTAGFIALFPPAVLFISGFTVFGVSPFAFVTTASAAALGGAATFLLTGSFHLASHLLTPIHCTRDLEKPIEYSDYASIISSFPATDYEPDEISSLEPEANPSFLARFSRFFSLLKEPSLVRPSPHSMELK